MVMNLQAWLDMHGMGAHLGALPQQCPQKRNHLQRLPADSNSMHTRNSPHGLAQHRTACQEMSRLDACLIRVLCRSRMVTWCPSAAISHVLQASAIKCSDMSPLQLPPHPSPISSANRQPRADEAVPVPPVSLSPMQHSYMNTTPSRWCGLRCFPIYGSTTCKHQRSN